jgi:hypothetical protein
MITRPFKLLALLAMVVLLVSGCGKSFVITQTLEQPIAFPSKCYIGDISDNLPLGTELKDRPTVEDIDKLRGFLIERLEEEECLSLTTYNLDSARYRVQGSILDFKKGSGLMRALFGFGIGAAVLTVNLELIDQNTNEIVFAGNFSESVTSYGESGAETFKRVAKNFAKELRKQRVKLMGS